MSVHSVAAELGVDVADVRAVVAWWTDPAEAVVDKLTLGDEDTLRRFLDPWGERTQLEHACHACGRWPAPYRFLLGWRPCRCGGHATRFCRDDNGGCGSTHHDPPLDPDTCTPPGSAPRSRAGHRERTPPRPP